MSLEDLCANCGAPVTSPFCSNCGQRLASPVHSVSHFVAEATEDLTHLDSRAWATIRALLFKPGLLTRKFLDGQRVRYLPPLRLYLALSLAFFLVITLLPPSDTWVVVTNVKDLVSREQGPQKYCAQIQIPPEATARGRALLTAIQKACTRDNGRTLHDAVFHAVSRAMFVFVPLLALVMMALYWRPRHFYIEHLLLLIHNHAFVFLLLTVWELVRRLMPWPVVQTVSTLVMVAYIAWYVYKSMRRVYGQGRWLTLTKMGIMSVAYVICVMSMFSAMAIYAAVTLPPA
jgi:hypothetical protein